MSGSRIDLQCNGYPDARKVTPANKSWLRWGSFMAAPVSLDIVSVRMSSMSELFEFGKRILEHQPFSVLLGTELEAFEPGTATLTLVVHEELKQQHGFVHGGVISYLADNALTYAGGSVLGDSVTSEYKINYLRPAIGKKLVAKAQVLSSGRTQAVCQCNVIAIADDEEHIVAVAQGTINKIDPKR